MVMVNQPEQLDQRAHERPDLLAGIIGSAMDAIIAIDDAQRIVLFNAAAERIFACPANEAIGSSVERFIPQRSRAAHDRHVRRFGENGVTNRAMGTLGTLWGLRANGEEFPIEAAISKVESDGKKFFTAVIRDITERHSAEEARRESEQRFRLVADTAPVLMWMSGADKLCTYFNKPWLDFTGRSLEEELGNGWAEGVHPDDFERCLRTYMQSFDRREKFTMEYRLRRHDGEYRWVLDMGVPRFNEDGSFAGYIGIGIDVTDRKRAEETLFRHAAIVESSDDAIIGTNVSGTVTDWNKGAERLFGYTTSEAIGENISFLAAPDHPDEGQGILKRVINGDAVKHHETLRQRKDGTCVHISLTASPIVDAEGRVVGASGIARDITKRKLAEQQRLLSENRFRQFFDTMPEYCYMVSSQGEIIDANPAACSAFGYTKDELVGKPLLSLYAPECRPKALELFQQWKTDGKLRSEEMVVITKQNQRKTVLLNAGSVKDADGNILHSTSVQVDITERKHAEQELSQSNERLNLTMEAGQIGGWEWDIRNGRNFWFGQKHAQLGSGPEEVHSESTQGFWDRVHAEDRGWLQDAVQAAVDNHKELNAEFRVVWPDGSVHWLGSKARFFYGADGQAERMLGMAVDITQRKAAEETLRESEERLRLAAQAGKMYAFEWDVATDRLVRSSEYVNVLGATEPRTLTHQQAMEKIHPDDRPKLLAAVAGLSPENPTVDVTYRVLLPGKSPVWVKTSGRAFFDREGRMLRVVGMVADVTDQKLAEEKLREYEKAVEGLEEMIVVIDREYRYLVANRKFLNMRHLTREQVVGRFAQEIVSKDAYEAIVKEKLEECFRGKAVRYEMKYTYPEIGERDLLVSYFPIEGASGIDRAACIFQDITERKRAEEALSGMSRKLIEAQEQERTRIARELHDDIGQRLSLIIVNLDLLEQKIPIARAVEHAEIHNVVDELDQLVTDVHDISHRLHSSKLEHLGLVAAVQGLCKEFAEKQRVQIDVQTHDLADPVSPEISVSLFRVLQEALHNAVKYSGVAHFDVALSQSSREIQLTVCDRGAGFDLDKAMKGRGLGLASMRERLRLIDGDLSIKSQVGTGTTIHASVPIKSRKEVA